MRIATLICGSDPQPMAAVVFSPDGRRLVTASNDATVKLWNVADPARLVRTAVLTRLTRGAGHLAFSPDLTSIGGTASDGADTVGLWPIRRSPAADPPNRSLSHAGAKTVRP